MMSLFKNGWHHPSLYDVPPCRATRSPILHTFTSPTFLCHMDEAIPPRGPLSRAAIQAYPFWGPYDYGWVTRGPTILFFGWVQGRQVHGTVPSMDGYPSFFEKNVWTGEYM